MPKLLEIRKDVSPFRQELAKRIRAAGEEKFRLGWYADGWLADCARAAGVGRSSLYAYVTGGSVPSVEILAKIAAACGVEPGSLIPPIDHENEKAKARRRKGAKRPIGRRIQ